MNVPIEIVAAMMMLFGGAVLASVGFTYRRVLQISERLARIEARLGIATFHENE